MLALLRTSRALAGVADAVGRWASWLFLPMMLVIVYDIVQRKVLTYYPSFQSSSLYDFLPSTKLQEGEWHLHAFLFLFCLGFAYVRNGHVRVELVRDHMGPRTRAWIEVIGCLLFLLPFCLMVMYFGYGQFLRSYAMNEASSATTGLPWRWVVRAGMLVGFFFLVVAGVSVLLKHIVYLFGPPELRSQVNDFVEVSEIEILKKDIEQELSEHEKARRGH
jgi:TRAP-type mannitol/chloroaromatic compound transport system permease small subunit